MISIKLVGPMKEVACCQICDTMTAIVYKLAIYRISDKNRYYSPLNSYDRIVICPQCLDAIAKEIDYIKQKEDL